MLPFLALPAAPCRFSVGIAVLLRRRNSSMPSCQAGTGLTHTGFPPMRRAGRGGERAVLSLPELSIFHGARRANTAVSDRR